MVKVNKLFRKLYETDYEYVKRNIKKCITIGDISKLKYFLSKERTRRININNIHVTTYTGSTTSSSNTATSSIRIPLSPINYCIYIGCSIDILDAIIDASGVTSMDDICRSTGQGWSYLHSSVCIKNIAVINHLIKKYRVNPCIKDKKGRTALFYSCSNEEIKNILLQYINANPDYLHESINNDAYYNSITSSNTVSMTTSDSSSSSSSNDIVNDDDGVGMIWNICTSPAISDSDSSDLLIQLMLDNPSLQVHFCWALLCKTVESGKLQCMMVLVNSDVSVLQIDANGFSLLAKAVACGHYNVVEYILSISTIADHDGNANSAYYSLHVACQHGYTDIAKLLIDHGADIDAMDKDGYTCLHYAASSSAVEIIILLIVHGAKIVSMSKSGDLPIDLIAEDAKELKRLFRAASVANDSEGLIESAIIDVFNRYNINKHDAIATAPCKNATTTGTTTGTTTTGTTGRVRATSPQATAMKRQLQEKMKRLSMITQPAPFALSSSNRVNKAASPHATITPKHVNSSSSSSSRATYSNAYNRRSDARNATPSSFGTHTLYKRSRNSIIDALTTRDGDVIGDGIDATITPIKPPYADESLMNITFDVSKDNSSRSRSSSPTSNVHVRRSHTVGHHHQQRVARRNSQYESPTMCSYNKIVPPAPPSASPSNTITTAGGTATTTGTTSKKGIWKVSPPKESDSSSSSSDKDINTLLLSNEAVLWAIFSYFAPIASEVPPYMYIKQCFSKKLLLNAHVHTLFHTFGVCPSIVSDVDLDTIIDSVRSSSSGSGTNSSSSSSRVGTKSEGLSAYKMQKKEEQKHMSAWNKICFRQFISILRIVADSHCIASAGDIVSSIARLRYLLGIMDKSSGRTKLKVTGRMIGVLVY